MTSPILTAGQADKLLDSAGTHFDTASEIFTRMASMATWTPQYDQLLNQARAHMAAGKADRARYDAWKDQVQLTARINAALTAAAADGDFFLGEAEANEAGKNADRA